METDLLHAKDRKCCRCGNQAAVWWPCIDIDIKSNPYCKACVLLQQLEVMKQLSELDKE